jgi:serine/threonine protein kinase
MTRDLANDPNHEERLNKVLLAYVEALQAGNEPDRRRLLADNPNLRTDLEAFFASYDQVERVAAPLREANQEGCEEPPGEPTPSIGQLGDFRLLREVGRGGMGVVYEAEQISLRRRVALKVLPFAAAIDPRQLQRFKNEALAAAHLRHENIVPVHAVGSERGVHYYAMQFIEGQSLAALIAEQRGQAGVEDRGSRIEDRGSHSIAGMPTVEARRPGQTTLPRGGRSSILDPRSSFFRTVAGFARQAALALEHAHQLGIVHRDIKPANLLLDPEERLWVTDFGLAQVGSDTGLTMTGELLGTLRYASPEQALARRGVVDHRSDIYSLGATLYELLTLRPLFEGRDRHELLRQIANDEPRPPRSVDPSIPLELETIVLKAINKEPGERYATARELADDLQRFLDDRPILARRPTLAERLWKLARRHPSVVVTGVGVLILLSAVSLFSTALILGEQQRTRAEQKKAEEAYERERQRAEEADARFRLARRSVDELFRVSEEELADRPGMELLRKRLLTSVVAFYQEFIELRRGDPQAQADLLETTKRVEKILADLAVLRAAGHVHLLRQPAVLEDLRVNEEQRGKIKELIARLDKQRWDSFEEVARLTPAERGRRFLEQARVDDAAVHALLTAEQPGRLRQIRLQSEGAGAFRDPEVASVLQLTTEQRDRIRAIEEEAFFAWMRMLAPGAQPGLPASAAGTKDGSPNERILALLSAEQARLWKAMTGEPFKGPPMPPFPPPFGPPPGPKGPSR